MTITVLRRCLNTKFPLQYGGAHSLCLACLHVTQGDVRVLRAWLNFQLSLHIFDYKRQSPTPVLYQATPSSSIPVAIYSSLKYQQISNSLYDNGSRPRERSGSKVCQTDIIVCAPTEQIYNTVHATCTLEIATNMPSRDDRYSNTYRPRSPRPRSRSPVPRVDSYRAGRSPPRRSSPLRRASPPRRGLASADTYTPGGNSRPSRPRSRSPAFRRRSRSPRRDDNWRARPRSPPRRNFSPRREDYRSDRMRSPRRDGYDSYTRSPRPRDRSPPIRTREASPARSRGVRSPLRASRYEEPRSRISRYA